MRMRHYLLGVGLLGILGVGGACAHESKYESAMNKGQEAHEAVATKASFADQLALLDQKEVALARMALAKTSDIDVRTFAQQLIENHEHHLASLQRYADATALSLLVIDFSSPQQGVGGSGNMGMEGAQRDTGQYAPKRDEKVDKQIKEFTGVIRELSDKSGKDFDKAFLEQVNKDQKWGQELVSRGLKEYPEDASLAVILGQSSTVFESQGVRAKNLHEAID